MAKSRLNSKDVSQILNQKKKNRKFRSFIIVLAAFVMALTSFSLSETGITMTADALNENVGAPNMLTGVLKKITGAGTENITVSGPNGWAELKRELESKTSGTYNVVVDGILAADSQIEIKSGVTVNISGKTGDSVEDVIYIKEGTTNFYSMFKAIGTLNVSNLNLSGKTASFTSSGQTLCTSEGVASDATNSAKSKVSYRKSADCSLNLSNSSVTLSGTNLQMGGTNLNKPSDSNKTINVGDSGASIVMVLPGSINGEVWPANVAVNSINNSTEYFVFANSSAGHFLRLHEDKYIEFIEDQNPNTSGNVNSYKWKIGADGGLVNVGDPNYVLYKANADSTSLTLVNKEDGGCSATDKSALFIGTSDGAVKQEVRGNDSGLATSGANNIKIYNSKPEGGKIVRDAEAESLVEGSYYFIGKGETTNNLHANDNGTVWNGDATAGTDKSKIRKLWKYSNGLFVNEITNQMIYFDGTSISVIKQNTPKNSPAGCTPASQYSEGSWTVNNSSNLNNVISTNGDDKGVFIIARDGGTVNLNSGATLKDITYTKTSGPAVAPIVILNGANTTVNVNNGALITNNVISYPHKDVDGDINNKQDAKNFFENKGMKMAYASGDPTPAGGVPGDRYSQYQIGTGSAGAIIVNQGTVNMKNGATISDNVADHGAIRIKSGTVNQDGGEIKDNYGFSGGAVSVEGGTYNLNSGKLLRNRSWWFGGAVSVRNDNATFKMGQGCQVPEISQNETLFKGGAIFTNSDNTYITSGLIKDNIAHVYGGGIYVNAGNMLVLKDTEIYDNTASNNEAQGFGNSQSAGFGNDDITGAGGGVWSCPTGETYYNLGSVKIWGNNAENTNPEAGDDFYQTRPWYGGGYLALFVSGDNWTDMHYVSGGKWNRTVEAGTPVDDGKGGTGPATPLEKGIGMRNTRTGSPHVPVAGACSTGNNKILIQGNTATVGGGVASNGLLAFAEDVEFDEYNTTLTVEKKWGQNIGTNTPAIQLNVKLINKTGANPVTVTENTIILGQNTTIGSDDTQYGAIEFDATNPYKVTMKLPPIYEQKQIVYSKLGLTEGQGKTFDGNDVNEIDLGKFAIQITEKVWDAETNSYVDGDEKYEVSLDDLYAIYTKGTPNVQTLPNGSTVTRTPHNYAFSTNLNNDEMPKYARVQITKLNKKNDEVLTNEDFEFSYIKVNKTNSGYQATSADYTKFDKNSGIHTSGDLSEGYYEIIESGHAAGFEGLKSKVYIYVSKSGDIRIEEIIGGDADNVTTPTITDITGGKNAGKLLAFSVYNEPTTGFELVKVNEKGVELTGNTQFVIKNFGGNYTYGPFTLEDSNSFRIEDFVSEFKNANNMTEQQVINTVGFYIQETQTHENNRYENLGHVIPFKLEKNNRGAIQFVSFTKETLEAVKFANGNAAAKDATGTSFAATGKKRSVINDAVYVEWKDDEQTIKNVSIQPSNGSITYTVTNEMKEIKVKVAKVDEDGNPITKPAKFTLRDGKDSSNGRNHIIGTANNPNNGIYTFDKNSEKNANGIGLNPNTIFCLWEQDAPNGYSKLGLEIFLQVDQHGIVSLVDGATLRKLANENKITVNKNDLDKIVQALENKMVEVGTADNDGVVTIKVKNYETTSYSVEKIWDDSYYSGERPKSIKVTLHAKDENGNELPVNVKDKEVTLSQGNSWKYTWTNLPTKDISGNTYKYYAIEESVSYYSTSYKYIEPQTSYGPITDWTRLNESQIANLNNEPVRIVVEGTHNGKLYRYAYYMNNRGVISFVDLDSSTAANSFEGMLFNATAGTKDNSKGYPLTFINDKHYYYYGTEYTEKYAMGSSPSNGRVMIEGKYITSNANATKFYYNPTSSTLTHVVNRYLYYSSIYESGSTPLAYTTDYGAKVYIEKPVRNSTTTGTGKTIITNTYDGNPATNLIISKKKGEENNGTITSTNNPLANAQFALQKVNKVDGEWVVDSAFDPIKLNTDSNGLDETDYKIKQVGYYRLIEESPPEGYSNLPDGNIIFYVDTFVEHGYTKYRIQLDETETDASVRKYITKKEAFNHYCKYEYMIEIVNLEAQYTLPETGGLGTSTCIGMGSIMIIIGALLLGKKYLSEVRG